MQYSQDKLDLLKDFTKMLNSKQELWRIQGGAGCGKTQFIKLLIEHYLAVNKLQTVIDPTTETVTSSNIFLTATTNKATAVITEDVSEPLETQYGALTTKTIYSLLGLKVFNDYKTGGTRVHRPSTDSAPTFPKNSLIIIDEASYLDWRMWKYIETDLIGHDLKIVFIADYYQATPVSSNMSPIFDPKIPVGTLTERHRYPKGSAIHTNSLLCEQAIDTGKGGKIQFDSTLVRIRSNELDDLINEHFVENQHNAKIVAYHNKTVVGYNNKIANLIYGNSFFNVGQQVVFNNYYLFGRCSVSNEATATVMKVGKRFYHKEHCIDCVTLDVKLHAGKTISIHVPADYHEFKEKLKSLAANKDWSNYYNLKEGVVDIRHSWACTSHKSQGSTYDFTIVDFNDLKQIKVLSDFYRMFNVAITRSRVKTYILKD